MQDLLESSSKEALPQKLGSTDLLNLFPRMGYRAVRANNAKAYNAREMVPLYFTKEDIVLFPPSTDNQYGTKFFLKDIATNVKRACPTDHGLLEQSKLLLFPVYQECNVMWNPRQNWVLLVFVTREKKFYLLDPTGPNRAAAYTPHLKHFEQSLKIFSDLCSGSPVIISSIHHLSLQPLHDAVSSGHWIAYFIYLLTKGQPLDSITNLNKTGLIPKISNVKTELVALPSMREEASFEGEVSPVPIVSTSDMQAIDALPIVEKQDYAAMPGNTDEVQSFLNSSVGQVPSQAATSVGNAPPKIGFGWQFDFYSMLIFSGTVTTIFALFCLGAGAGSVLSTTVGTGLLASGVVLFLGGALGKCGLFGGFPGNATSSQSSFNQRSGLTSL